jgi:D-serine deaminase-like pyridoxal phosphate-dependent protein
MDPRIGRDLFDGRTPLPAFVLRETALANDIAVLADFCRSHGVSFAPHGKTTMAPAIFRRQMDAGAWGITLATTGQAAVGVDAGVERIVIANEVVDDQGVAWIGEILDHGAPDLWVFVDSVAAVRRLSDGLGSRRRRLPVLIEMGIAGGRAGVRTAEDAEAVARAVDQAPALALAGVALYEGVVAGATDAEKIAAVQALADLTRAVTERLRPLFERAGIDEVIVSGGGSHYFDVVAEALTRPWPAGLPVRIVLRSGAYISHDHGIYERSSPFGLRAAPGGPRLRPAIEVWAPVLSLPEPGLMIAGAGRRDLPIDQDLPVVIKVRGDDGRVRDAGDGFTVQRLNDQHAFIEVSPEAAAGLAVGDLVAFGISHPCTAFQLWREAILVDDADRILDVYELRFP